MNFKVGDRVVVTEDFMRLKGKHGTIRGISGQWNGVEFDESIGTFGHDLKSKSPDMPACEDGYGYLLMDSFIKKEESSAFKVKCTKSKDDRFTVGKIYSVGKDGRIEGDSSAGGPVDSFEHWYTDAGWKDYDFELVKESKMFTKDDIRSGDKIVTKYGSGIVVEFNGTRIIRYDNEGGYDVVEPISLESIKTVIRPQENYELGAGRFEDGKVVFDREKGIGCAVKEITVSEAEKALTEKFGQNVRIRVGE